MKVGDKVKIVNHDIEGTGVIESIEGETIKLNLEEPVVMYGTFFRNLEINKYYLEVIDGNNKR